METIKIIQTSIDGTETILNLDVAVEKLSSWFYDKEIIKQDLINGVRLFTGFCYFEKLSEINKQQYHKIKTGREKMKRLEVKIGEVIKVEHEGKKIKLVAEEDVEGKGCDICRVEKFHVNCDKLKCDRCCRADGKNIYFAEK